MIRAMGRSYTEVLALSVPSALAFDVLFSNAFAL